MLCHMLCHYPKYLLSHGIEPIKQLINRVAPGSTSWKVYWSNGYCRLHSTL